MKNISKTLLIIAFYLIGNYSIAQDKILTAEDAIYMNRATYPVSVSQLQWVGSTDYYAYSKENSFFKVGAKSGTETLIFDVDMLNSALNIANIDSVKKIPRINFYSDDKCRFSLKNNYYDYNFEDGIITRINSVPDSAENIDFENDTRFIAYTSGNNVFIAIDGDILQVTNEENKGIVCGQAVHRVEFGIHKGLFWSPESKKLAYYRMDESMVTDYPLVNTSTRIAETENIKYPMAGMTSHQVTVEVFDLQSRKTTTMKTGLPADQYLTSVTWDPSGEYIYIGLLNREQNHFKLNCFDVETGEPIKTLFEEKHPIYVEPEHNLYFLPNDPNKFIWQSERDGFNHLYLYNTNGDLIEQLTSGDWVVTELLGVYPDKYLWFKSTKESPLQQNIYKTKIGSKKIQLITKNHGTHRALINKKGNYLIDIYSSTDISREYLLLNSKGKTLRVIKENQDPLKDYNLGKTEIFTIKADNGDDLYCRMIKPMNFDSTKKYPVIVYVYGGPHAQLITDSWLGGAGLFLNYLAQQGYIIFTLDNHGSANRGRKFEQVIHRQLGVTEVNDQMLGVKYLLSLPFVDADRVGVDGWSYGGFMTINMMLENPGVFKAGVAGGPVIDWKYYEVMYGERYMDTPQENPEGYSKSNLLNKVDNLEGKLLIIHGANDPTVVWQNSLQFLKKAIDADKDIDYFVYPGHGHNMRGINRAHLYKKISSYFNDYLK